MRAIAAMAGHSAVNLDSFIKHNTLPPAFRQSAEDFFLPYGDWLATRIDEHVGPALVLGINGAQGTGKSTVAALLQTYLADRYGRDVVTLSIDDIYLTRAERALLARDIHPLLATRGVPGTHDVELGISIVNQLKSLREGESIAVPRFDKARDDRFAETDWPRVDGPVDLVILEGWCVGSKPCAYDDLLEAQNELEATRDSDRSWRTYVNEQLRGRYTRLFELLDTLLVLRAPSFDAVYRWRVEQEHKLAQSNDDSATGVMSDDEVATFIQHYERITRHNIRTLPEIADAIIDLDNQHRAVAMTYS